jgi:hypothetical protein
MPILKIKYIPGKGNRKRRVFVCQCDQCDKIFDRYGKPKAFVFCTNKCRYEAQRKGGILDIRNRRLFREKHGVDYPMQIEAFAEKQDEIRRQTMQERYDTTVPNKIWAVKKRQQEKRRQTMLKRYGTIHPTQVSEFIEKQRATMEENGGYPLQNEKTRIKSFISRFGMSPEEYTKTLPERETYQRVVRSITEQQALATLLHFDKRGAGGYDLDHKFSIAEGFKQSILPAIIGNIANLEFIDSSANRSKGSKCSITLPNLFKSFDKHTQGQL